RAVALRDPRRIRVVVVDADDVGGDALPAVIADDRARRVEGLGQMVESLHVVPLGGAVGQVRNTPRLVERHPRDDARMAVVPLDGRLPLPGDALDAAARDPTG